MTVAELMTLLADQAPTARRDREAPSPRKGRAMIGAKPQGYRKGWRPCTCHPDERPTPCPRQYALSACLALSSEVQPVGSERSDELKPQVREFGETLSAFAVLKDEFFPAESGAGVCQGSEADTAQGNLPPDEPLDTSRHVDGAGLELTMERLAARLDDMAADRQAWSDHPDIGGNKPTFANHLRGKRYGYSHAAQLIRSALGAGEGRMTLDKALRVLEPHLDAVICYASSIHEHPPNEAVMVIRAHLSTSAALAQPSPLDTSGRVEGGSSVAESTGAGPDGPGACDAQCQSEGGAQ